MRDQVEEFGVATSGGVWVAAGELTNLQRQILDLLRVSEAAYRAHH